MRIAVAVFGESKVPPSVAIDQAPSGSRAIFAVVPGSSPMLGQTVDDVPPGPPASPKASKGKATCKVPRPACMAASSSAIVGELQPDTPGEQQPDAPGEQRAPCTLNLEDNSPSKVPTQKDEDLPRSTHSLRYCRPATVGRAWKMVRLQGRVTKQKGGKKKSRTCTENGEMDMQEGNSESTAGVNPETSAGSDLSPVAPGASAQAEVESNHKVVAKVAGIRQREAVEGTSTNPS